MRHDLQGECWVRSMYAYRTHHKCYREWAIVITTEELQHCAEQQILGEAMFHLTLNEL